MSLSDISENILDNVFQTPQEQTIPLSPHNNDVEQALLGAILVNNEALNKVDDRLQCEHFYAPLHQEIFKKIIVMREAGLSATHLTLGYNPDYLAKLMMLCVSGAVVNVFDCSQILIDLKMKRNLIEIAEQTIVAIRSDLSNVDAMQHLEQTEQKLFALSQGGSAGSTLTSFGICGMEAVKAAEAAHKARGELVGISTGIQSLDTALGGLQDSNLIILAGRPSMGKTALATNIAYNVAKSFNAQEGDKKKHVAFFSLEMSSQELSVRILSGVANVNSQSVLRGQLNDDEIMDFISANEKLLKLPLLIDSTAAISVSALRTRARRFMRTHNIGLIVIDYLQLLTIAAQKKQFNRVQEVSEITQGLKALAKELNVPVIALSQLSRALESRDDKRPQLSDLRDSGSIEQDADIVMFVYREQYYLERKKPEVGTAKYQEWATEMDAVRGKAEVLIAKHRHGAIGTVMLNFDGGKTQFSD